MTEEWKYIAEAPDYMISNYGRILSKKNNYYNKILKPKLLKNGYLAIGLMVNGLRKFFLVHRLVLITFNPTKNMDILEVNHKDENRTNNHINNLEWTTSKQNCNYGTRNNKLSQQHKVKVLCIETGIIYNSFEDAANAVGIDKGGINMCCTGYRNRKTAGGYHWRYANV